MVVWGGGWVLSMGGGWHICWGGGGLTASSQLMVHGLCCQYCWASRWEHFSFPSYLHWKQNFRFLSKKLLIWLEYEDVCLSRTCPSNQKHAAFVHSFSVFFCIFETYVPIVCGIGKRSTPRFRVQNCRVLRKKNCLIGKQISVLVSMTRIQSATEGSRFFYYENLKRFQQLCKISITNQLKDFWDDFVQLKSLSGIFLPERSI